MVVSDDDVDDVVGHIGVMYGHEQLDGEAVTQPPEVPPLPGATLPLMPLLLVPPVSRMSRISVSTGVLPTSLEKNSCWITCRVTTTKAVNH